MSPSDEAPSGRVTDTKLSVEILDADPSSFTIETHTSGARATGARHRVSVRFDGSEAVTAAVRVSVTVPGTAAPWWLIPGLFYGDNRPAENDRPYPRFEAPHRSAG
ncbi:MAG: hypothetical protein K0Q52_2864, partial [Microbacterium sp.]|nr:hypothetical protein [Microbacterium sp.]